MIRVALRGLLGRKLRAILTALAVILGVAMISGTFVLTDTIDKAFDSLFTDSYTGTDVVISGAEIFETDFGQPPPFDESLYDDVIRVDGVDAATRGISDFAQLTDKDDEPITTGGAPTLGFGLDAQNESFERFNPLGLEAGAGDLPIALSRVYIAKVEICALMEDRQLHRSALGHVGGVHVTAEVTGPDAGELLFACRRHCHST
jgi:putative ABC transport system permease protein